MNRAGNSSTDSAAVVAGGYRNLASSKFSFVGGGVNDSAKGTYAAIGGGDRNLAIGSASFIGGGTRNRNDGDYGTIAGGAYDTVAGAFGVVGGGYGSYVYQYGTVSGGLQNRALFYCAVGGGVRNSASGNYSFVGGGEYNYTASGADYSVIGGGRYDTITGTWATVSGGNHNVASAEGATVAGGMNNIASGPYSTVAGGSDNTAAGWRSFVCGFAAKATYDNTFLFGDGTAMNLYPERSDQARFRVNGGFKMDLNGYWVDFYNNGAGRLINTSTGGYLSTGGTWTNASSRDLKAGFTAVDGEQLLEKLESLPVTEWYYKAEGPAVTHIGPTAQDFHATFGVGGDTTAISTVDPSGVALAAIQQLIKENQELRSRIERLEKAAASKSDADRK